ncbi:hypothetical protein INT08_00355 [Prosthecochloris sp. N3]|uniref:Glycerophosphoryl diester phosphodiesterase membrane domain-containing protein n=1 Tax=Prosthecochloris ethylica TaxID=2743976 RepID=A0ABR9XNL2_9CHLB|nr:MULTISPECIES: hypothetical protein [Prosthecochloris]MEC9487389.1 hypothetical protein [Prosthecochloris sp.]MBF0585721.1 hypothetical protein [Prosthecochloris ethylica]MBF0635631.1 hypothetical protein [Prosthecochloris ethylica]NUK46930.1 hypothetical protein [Prosthecochloris ethylica]RNA65425.1 hypothetical protein CR163_009490 [Prosthecochloris sp. ZM_2]
MEQGARPFDTGLKIDPARFDRVVAGGYSVNAGEYLRQGWELFRAHAAESVVYTLLVFLVTAVVSMFDVFGSLLLSVVTAPLYAGFVVVALKGSSDERFVFSDLFQGFNYFLPLVVSALMMWLFVALGFVLLVLPGVYLVVSYLFVVPLIVDYHMEFWQAMETSRKIITANWFSMFVLLLLLSVINIFGALVFGIGLLVTVPLTAFSLVMAYRDIVGGHGYL